MVTSDMGGASCCCSGAAQACRRPLERFRVEGNIRRAGNRAAGARLRVPVGYPSSVFRHPGPFDKLRTGLIRDPATRSEENPSELQSLMRSSYAGICLKRKKKHHTAHSYRLPHETK